MAAFQVISGFHRRGKEIYQKGEVITSDSDLKRAFPGKFIQVPESDADPAKSTKKKSKKEKVESLREMVSKRSEIGKDVSVLFPEALSRSLRVYRTPQGQYNVAKEEDPNEALNTSPLSKMKVGRFIGDLADQ